MSGVVLNEKEFELLKEHLCWEFTRECTEEDVDYSNEIEIQDHFGDSISSILLKIANGDINKEELIAYLEWRVGSEIESETECVCCNCIAGVSDRYGCFWTGLS